MPKSTTKGNKGQSKLGMGQPDALDLTSNQGNVGLTSNPTSSPSDTGIDTSNSTPTTLFPGKGKGLGLGNSSTPPGLDKPKPENWQRGHSIKGQGWEKNFGDGVTVDDDLDTGIHPDSKANWSMVFSDEFNGTELDRTKWDTEYYYGSRTNSFNNELQYYTDGGNFEFNNGVLSIIAKEETVQGETWFDSGKTFDYTSGMISGHDSISFTYGYFEISGQSPTGQGLWPAFWMLPESGEWPPEIDIMEILGDDTSTAYTTVHYQDPSQPGNHGMEGSWFSGIDFADGMHTFAVDWQPGELTWYIDGMEVFNTTENVPDQPMYMLANLAVGGNWPGSPDETTAFPSSFDIDYIRVYQDSTSVESGLTGGSANDTLSRVGEGFLEGRGGDDILIGGTGSNLLVGGTGNDTLIDLEGYDTFTGGIGNDLFVLGDASGSAYDSPFYDGYAILTDFDAAEDMIQLSGNASKYSLGAATEGDVSGAGIYRGNDLIAIVENTTVEALDLDASYVSYV